MTRLDPDRTETAIEQLTAADDTALPQLTGQTVQVSVTQPGNENCQHTLFAAVNLLARLEPVVDTVRITGVTETPTAVTHPNIEASHVDDALHEVERQVGSSVDVETDPGTNAPDAVLHLGSGRIGTRDCFEVSVSSDGWLTEISTTSVVAAFSDQVNPVGAYTAGCIGCAEVFKHFLQEGAVDINAPIEQIEDVTFSTFDYSTSPADPANPPLPDDINVGELDVIGVGAGGGACIHVLSVLESLDGSIRLVDPDEVSRSNLNRYIWAVADDVDREKTTIGKELLETQHAVDVEYYPVSFDDLSDRFFESGLDLLISTVDKGEVRRNIQWEFPKNVLDAATDQRGKYVVSKIQFGETQCLGCKYDQQGDDKRREMEALSEHIGLATDKLLELDQHNGAFSEDQVAEIRRYVADDVEFELPRPGDRFSDWRQAEQCGQMVLERTDTEVPIPFLPVTAGVLLAGEVIKHRYYPSDAVANRFAHNMLYKPREVLQQSRGPNDDCSICQDKIARQHYRDTWG
jgi:molybdopterin/thiamine biosynthesis adenylyltransferase